MKTYEKLRSMKIRCVQSHIVWQVVFYGVPILLIFAVSFQLWSVIPPELPWGGTAYDAVFENQSFRIAIINSLIFSSVSAASALIFGMPLAYVLHLVPSSGFRRFLLIALAVPFFSSYLLRAYGWQFWLNNQSFLALIERYLSGQQEVAGVLNTDVAAFLGILSILIPISSILIYLALSYQDSSLILAARNLGAGPWARFYRIEFQQAVPALLISFQFCFLLAFGDVVAMPILGGNSHYYFSIAILDQIKNNDWPAAAVLGVMLLIISLLSMGIIFKIMQKTRVMTMLTGDKANEF
jgi:ABC-type spermidine/putrescine transport system permease subunit I